MTWTSVGFTPIFGIPAIAYGGILTLLLLLATATLGYGVRNFKTDLNLFKWHIIMARVTIVFGVLHGFFAIIAIF